MGKAWENHVKMVAVNNITMFFWCKSWNFTSMFNCHLWWHWYISYCWLRFTSHDTVQLLLNQLAASQLTKLQDSSGRSGVPLIMTPSNLQLYRIFMCWFFSRMVMPLLEGNASPGPRSSRFSRFQRFGSSSTTAKAGVKKNHSSPSGNGGGTSPFFFQCYNHTKQW